MATYSSPLPVGCRFTSGFGLRWGTLHAGTDWGPPKPGQSGVPVFAVADGKVVKTGRGNGGSTSTVAPYHSGRAVLIDHGNIGGDRMRTYYGHLQSYSVRPGDRVRAGEKIGVMGGSGARGDHDFAVHLHIGVMQNASRPVRASRYRGDPGWIDSRAWLESKGVRIGREEPASPSSSSRSSSRSSNRSSSSGGSKPWPQGPLTVVGKHNKWTHKAWVKLLKDVGHKNAGKNLTRAMQNWLKKLGYYKGYIDSSFGSLTTKALQAFLRDKGVYKGRIDGDRGPLTVKSEVAYLNSQRRYYD